MLSLKAMPKISFWRVIAVAIFTAGAIATYGRFAWALGGSTNLNDAYPWGIWVAAGTLCAIGLSASGFTISAAVYILGLKRYKPIVRTCVLISFLGYLSVMPGYVYELGLPWRFYNPFLYWNRHSILFEVLFCVVSYTGVLALEFAPAVFEKLPDRQPWQWMRRMHDRFHHRALIAIVIAGILFSSMHQSFLGGLFLIAKGRLYPLWWTQNLPALSLLSAIAGGLALCIMVLYLAARSLKANFDYSILQDVSRVVGLMLVFYILFRGLDLVKSGGAPYLFAWRQETLYFWLEIALFAVIPLLMLSFKKVRDNPVLLYWASASVVAGFVLNRTNLTVTALEASAGKVYVPSWMEMAVTLMIYAGAVIAFRLAAEYLDIFDKRRTAPAPAWRDVARYPWSTTDGKPAQA